MKTTQELENEIGQLREMLAEQYIKQSGIATHASDCATSCAPAQTPAPCDCEYAWIEKLSKRFLNNELSIGETIKLAKNQGIVEGLRMAGEIVSGTSSDNYTTISYCNEQILSAAEKLERDQKP